MTRFEILLEGYKNDTLSEDELQELLQLWESNHSTLEAGILHDLQQKRFAGLTSAAQRQRLFEQVLRKSQQATGKARVIGLWRRIAVAAAILILAGAATYIWLIHTPENKVAKTGTSNNTQNDVQPGGNKAILTLADGSHIILNNAANGALTTQGNSVVNKTKDGELQYQSVPKGGSNRQSAIITYNILSTPKGGQYQLVLPDGTKVWLNAASSIKYPTVFADHERRVELTGEAYFEVMKNHHKPFTITIPPPATGGRGAGVEVLGTHFNVSAYHDEADITTTLLEGKVKVVNGEWSMVNGQSASAKASADKSAILAPGQQAVIASGHSIQVKQADVEQAVAWKNGQFAFSNTDIETIMRQMARWYDVEVEYKARPADRYTVSISRNVPVSKLLRFLELSGGVHFRVDGSKVIVMK